MLTSFSAISVCNAEDKKHESENASTYVDDKVHATWKSSAEPFVTIPLLPCWDADIIRRTELPPEPSENFAIMSTDRCGSSAKTKWSVIYSGPNPKAQHKNPRQFPATPKKFAFSKEMKLNGRIVRFYKHSAYHWKANFNCGGVYFDIAMYGFDYRPEEPIEKDMGTEVPSDFKDFISKIKCDSKR